MKKKFLCVLIGLAMFSLVACGKKLDTSNVNGFNPESLVTKLPAEVDDGCISVLEMRSYFRADGKEVFDDKYVYDQDGKISEIMLNMNTGDNPEDLVSFSMQYNEFGFPVSFGYCTFLDDNGVTVNESFVSVVTDPNGYCIHFDDATTYEVDGNGNFLWVRDMEGLKVFTYENDLITKIVFSNDMIGCDSTTDYYYNNGKLFKVVENYEQRDGSGHGTKTTIYEDERTVYEEEFFNENDEKSFSLNYEIDDRGMYTYYDEVNKDVDDIHLVGIYNGEKTVYTFKNQNPVSQVVGYQEIFSEDGRPIKVYKIDKDGRPIGDLLDYKYDAQGHLLEVISIYYDKGGEFSGPGEFENHHYFKRVPKSSYIESDFYKYPNILSKDSTDIMNMLDLIEE